MFFKNPTEFYPRPDASRNIKHEFLDKVRFAGDVYLRLKRRVPLDVESPETIECDWGIRSVGKRNQTS